MREFLKKYGFILLIILITSISLSGCAWVPWGGDDEEVELEGDFTEEEFEAVETEDPFEMDEIRTELRNLQSQQEEAQLKLEELDDVVSSLSPRMNEIEDIKRELDEGGGNTNSAQIEMLKDTVHKLESEIVELKDNLAEIEFDAKLKRKPVAGGSVNKNYKEALRLFNIKQYKASLRLFKSLDNNRTSISLRDNVLFWIGQCFFKMGDYEKAVEDLNTVIDEYKDGNKVADSLYLAGASYNILGEKSKALDYLNRALGSSPDAQLRKKIEFKIKEIEG